ncbi:MAG TPA: hypothetical protein VGQ99_19425 [Tepidisphaeraceae bacterium]|nr:hypothetical protein [Tepidisphaeraceae bacterium]
MQVPIADSQAAPAIADSPENLVQRWIVKLRWPIFALVGFILIAGHNGYWRLGRDSSLYRAVADNLASGRGYTFRGQREHHIYPGLPYFLAGINKIFGHQDPLHPRAALLIMMAMSMLTLVVVYHLVSTYFPPWIAVAVTTGVGINHEFLQQTHELMTDLPFLLGASMTMLGIARLPKAATTSRKAWFAVLILLGAVIAVSMRPTFWALLLAWIGACFVGLLHSRRWLAYGIGIAIAVAIIFAWVALDPRSPGHSIVGGRYEQKVVATLQHLKDVKWQKNLGRLSTRHLPEFFFGLELPMPWGPLVCSVLLMAGVLLVRKSPLWGLYVIVTAGMTIVLGGAARYYLMVLPLLLVGWATFANWIADVSTRWYRSIPFAGELVLLFWLGLATGPHLVRDSGFVLEQHGYAKDHSHKEFLEVYRGGSGKKLIAISQAVSERVPAKAVVFGFEPRIVSYLSGRHVYHPAEVLKGLKQRQWPVALRKSRASWIFHEKAAARRDGGVLAAKLLRTRAIVLVPGTETTTNGIVLARITISDTLVRKKPTTRPTTRPTTSATLPATTRKAAH